MNKAYLIAPLVLLLVFIGFYAAHRSGYQEREAAKVAATATALQAKNQADLEARRAAMTEAIAAAEQRKIEREAKAAREAADKATRQLAIDARDRAFRDQERTGKQIERLKKDLETEATTLAKLATAQKAAAAEKAFLQTFITQAQANVQALQTLLTRLNTPPPPATTAK